MTVTTTRAVSGYDSGNHNIKKKKNPNLDNSSPRPDLVEPWCFLVRLRGVQSQQHLWRSLGLSSGQRHKAFFLACVDEIRAERQYVAVPSGC